MILLDTNVMSELAKPSPDSVVQHWFLLAEDDCYLPAIAIAEVAFGIARMPDGSRKARLSEQLAGWRVRYADRTFGFGAITAMIYGDVMSEAKGSGHNMSTPDGQIAAIAIEQGAALATRNCKDFATTSLTLINPWN